MSKVKIKVKPNHKGGKPDIKHIKKKDYEKYEITF